MAFSWITFVQGRQQLAARLADPSNAFWTDLENGLYLKEALQAWNALTFTWKTTFTFGVAAASTPEWVSLGTMVGSPRSRTTTDTALYTLMEFHLLEPPTGGTWSGTSQFTIADLSSALQRCRDEAIQATNCNQASLQISGTPNVRIVTLPDTCLEVSRLRWLPVGGSNATLMRNDDTGFNIYTPGWLQDPAATPTQYNVASTVPLTVEVDIAPASEGEYDLIVLDAGQAFDPPAASLLNVPDDFAWVLKWGALGDLLGRESEATDTMRSEYCWQRYRDGLAWMQNTPWVTQAYINGVTANLVCVADLDRYNPEWDSAQADLQTVAFDGIDFLTVVPQAVTVPPSPPISVALNLLGNAPLPVADADFIQCSRDVWDSILDYAQFLAAFKQGGAEFIQAQPLEKRFLDSAKAANRRLQKLGLFADVFNTQAGQQNRDQERT